MITTKMSSSRTQNMLANQLLHQIRLRERKYNQRLHRELRHRVRELETVNDHFDELEENVTISFEKYRVQIEDAFAVSQMRFELCINERLETILDHDYRISHSTIEEDIGDDKYDSRMNSMLFFQSLYPTTNVDGNNDTFYMTLFIAMTTMFVAGLFDISKMTDITNAIISAIVSTPPHFLL